jgi:hypothetical protein
MDLIYCKFMKDQIEEIKKYKWLRSEEVGFDLGTSATQEWICKYAKTFRETWYKEYYKRN